MAPAPSAQQTISNLNNRSAYPIPLGTIQEMSTIVGLRFQFTFMSVSTTAYSVSVQFCGATVMVVMPASPWALTIAVHVQNNIIHRMSHNVRQLNHKTLKLNSESELDERRTTY